MKKQLAHYKTLEQPPLYIINNELQPVEGDFIGCYDNKLFCRGAIRLTDTPFLMCYGDDFSDKKTGFVHGEIIHLFYYDSVNDLFLSLDAEFVNRVTGEVSTGLVYYPMTIFEMTNVSLGKAINLNIDEYLTEEGISIAEIPTWKSGDNPQVVLNFTAKNIKDLQVTKQIGQGNLFREQSLRKRWIYEVNGNDQGVVLGVSGRGVYSDELIEMFVEFQCEIDTHSDNYFSNERFILYPENNNLVLQSVTGERVILSITAPPTAKIPGLKIVTFAESNRGRNPRIVQPIGRLKNFYCDENGKLSCNVKAGKETFNIEIEI